MPKRLELIHSHDGETVYVRGENCDDIQHTDGGYLLVRGKRRDTLHFHRVLVYSEEQRPGVTPEPSANAPSPKFAERDGKGWKCKECGHPSSTVHGIKVHHARVHVNA